MTGAPLAVFRVDAAPEIGAGHAMRCLTLANALSESGWRCAFASSPGTTVTVQALGNSQHQIHESEKVDQPDHLRQSWDGGCDLLIVDHYGLDAAFETPCRGWAKSILVIDDLVDRRHDCDVLLDQTAGRVTTDYLGLFSPGCRLLMGTPYALLRPEFTRMRGQTLPKERNTQLKRLFVSLGATDPYGVTQRVIEGIAESGIEVQVDVVLGSSAPQLDAVHAQIEGLPLPARLHIESNNIPALMASADLAVGGGGTSAWERCCLGLPTILFVLAENQRYVAAALAATGAALLVEESPPSVAKIAKALKDMALDNIGRQSMAEAAATMCDGRGAARVMMELRADIVDRDGTPVRLRPTCIEDSDLILAWQSHPQTRKYSHNPAVPTPDEHFAWFADKLRNPRCLLNVILHDGTPAGLLRFEKCQRADDIVHEISILVAPQLCNRGIGKAALALGRLLLPEESLWAEVRDDNAASAAMFGSAGMESAEVFVVLRELVK